MGTHAGYENRKHSGREDEGNYIENSVNARTVWVIPTQSFNEAHFATFPPELPRRVASSQGAPSVTRSSTRSAARVQPAW